MSGYGQPTPPFPQVGASGGAVGYGPRGASDDQLWAMLAYLLTFVAAVIAPLVVYLIKRDESPYARYHSAQSLNLNLTGWIYGLVAFVVFVVLDVTLIASVAAHPQTGPSPAMIASGLVFVVFVAIFALFGLIFGIVHLVYLIMAAVAAYKGELYRIPKFLCLPIVR
jgi:uncharacterized Tic20 family protein